MSRLIQPIFNTFRLDHEKKSSPLKTQLYEKICRLIDSGQLKPDDPLPSSRQLSESLNLSRSTVTAVYQQLEEEGYTKSIKGSGTYVSNPLPYREVESWTSIETKPVVQPKNLSSLANIALQSIAFSVQKQIPFALIAPDIGSLPGKKWTQIVARISKSPWLHNGYCPPGGYLPFRQNISDYLRRSRGISCDAHQVIVTNGIQEGINLCCQILFNEGDEVAIEDPSFQLHTNLLEFRGLKPRFIPVNKDGIRIEDLKKEETIKGCLVTPTHQYPLGYRYSMDTRKSLLEWAGKNGSWILEDDYDSELRYGGKPYPALAALSNTSSTVYLGSFTKVIYPGFNMGYMVVPRDTVGYFEGAKLLNTRHASEVHQVILAEFMEGGFYESHVRRLKKMYEQRRLWAIKAVEKYLSDFGMLLSDNQGTHLTFLFDKVTDDVRFCEFLRESFNVESRPLSACFRRAHPISGLILGYAHFNELQINGAAKALRKALLEFGRH